MVILALLVGLAAAADPPPSDDEEVDGSLVVYGELLVDRARARVIRGFEAEGYEVAKDKGDYVLLRHDAPWKGEVRVYDDGWIRMKRQPLRVEGREWPWASKNSPLSWATCVLVAPACIRSGGALVSPAKFNAQKERTLGGMEPDLQEWGDRVADLHTDHTVEGLVGRLETLWGDGVPLEDDGAVLTTMEGRRQALLAWWDSRTENAWGERVRASIEMFIREEVQYSEHAFTSEELAAFNARRSSERVLDLERPLPELVASIRGRVVEPVD